MLCLRMISLSLVLIAKLAPTIFIGQHIVGLFDARLYDELY